MMGTEECARMVLQNDAGQLRSNRAAGSGDQNLFAFEEFLNAGEVRLHDIAPEKIGNIDRT